MSDHFYNLIKKNNGFDPINKDEKFISLICCNYLISKFVLPSELLLYIHEFHFTKKIQKYYGELCHIKNIWEIPLGADIREKYKINQFGEKHGLYRSYHNNKHPHIITNYINDKIHGLYEKWYTNGSLQKRINYDRGIKNGLYEEWYIKIDDYYNTRKYINQYNLKIRVNYTNDKMDGLYESWYPNGRPKVKVNYLSLGDAKGRMVGIYNEYFDNGNIKISINYKINENGESIRDGLYEERFINGNIKLTQNYENGKRTGTRYLYCLTKNKQSTYLQETINFVNDKREGISIRYFSPELDKFNNDGDIKKEELTYKNNVKHGKYYKYYKNGKINIVANYEEDQLKGKYYEWSKEDTLIVNMYFH